MLAAFKDTFLASSLPWSPFCSSLQWVLRLSSCLLPWTPIKPQCPMSTGREFLRKISGFGTVISCLVLVKQHFTSGYSLSCSCCCHRRAQRCLWLVRHHLPLAWAGSLVPSTSWVFINHHYYCLVTCLLFQTYIVFSTILHERGSLFSGRHSSQLHTWRNMQWEKDSFSKKGSLPCPVAELHVGTCTCMSHR